MTTSIDHHWKGCNMALVEITQFFRHYREKGELGVTVLQKAQENARCLFRSSLANYGKYDEVPKEVFSRFLQALLHSDELKYNLTAEQEEKIQKQLQKNSRKMDEELFVICWNYWLRKDITPSSALLIVDIQNDFISGTLAVKEAVEVVPVINNLIQLGAFDVTVYTQDWHPSDHCSYASNVKLYPLHSTSPTCAEDSKVFDTVVYEHTSTTKQVLWPTHCEQNSWGAELHKDLKQPQENDLLVKKGSDPAIDSYSAFWDNADCSCTPLFADLLKRGVTEVFICGLAFDYCVAYTADDATDHGFKTFVVEDACRAISSEGAAQTTEMFGQKGITLVRSSNVCSHLSRKG